MSSKKVKLAKQTTLYFQQGRSDKVYQVDLCELGPDQYVVNFRYGRRGATLREGTKTTGPVTYREAETIFNELLDSRKAKGYTEELQTAPAAPPPPPPRTVDVTDRKQAVLLRLQEGRNSSSNWSLSRAIWRAAELEISEAEPLLHPLVGIDEMTDYCIAWAMGRFALPNSVPVLEQIGNQKSHPEHLRQMAAQALRQCANDSQRASLIGQAIDSLPAPLDALFKSGVDAFSKPFLDGIGTLYPADLLTALYYIDDSSARSVLIQALQTMPLKPPFFRPLRRIFKAAELRCDGQVFGLLALRFEKVKGNFRSNSWFRRNPNRHPALGANPANAFSVQTRTYNRRRAWRTLKRLGEANSDKFVPMAVGVLLAYNDSDAKEVRTMSHYDWQSRTMRTIQWDPYGDYWAFNQLLFRNSQRYDSSRGLSFRLADGQAPDGLPPDRNEAAFPELWEKQPRGLLHLLTDSQCLPVHQFAAKAIRKCESFCNDLPIEVIMLLLAAKYDVTNELGLDLAVARYDANNPDFELVLALVKCPLARARSQARDWIVANPNPFFADTEFAYEVLACEYSDIRQMGQEFLHKLPTDQASVDALTGRLVAFMQAATVEQSECAADVGNTLLRPQFQQTISRLGEDVICDLLKSELPEVQYFAGNVVLNHETLSKQPTEKVLRAMLDATHPPVRSMAIKIISELPDDVLLENAEMLAGLTCHELKDIRNEVRPIVKRLADQHDKFAKEMSSILIKRLLMPGAPEGVPSHTSRVLREDFAGKLDHVTPETVTELLASRSGPAQEVGGFLLPTNVDPKTLEVVDIVKLAKSSVLTVREAAWHMYGSQVDRIRAELSTAVRILDSNWEDSRQFGFKFFEEHTNEDDLSPEVLISICDSVREDVQQFGRNLIVQRFAKEHGPEYLLKLSEHPSTDLQLFASNFLVEYGSEHPDRIEKLSPYFVSILSRVNKSRVAKDRVLGFLKAEAIKHPESAQTISEILARISATCAIGDRAKTIEAMVELHEAYPEIELPIELQTTEVR